MLEALPPMAVLSERGQVWPFFVNSKVVWMENGSYGVD